MWPFRKRPVPVEPMPKSDQERLDDAEDSLRHLERRFTRLQQQFTRWARDYDEATADDGEDDEDEDDTFDRLLAEKRGARG